MDLTSHSSQCALTSIRTQPARYLRSYRNARPSSRSMRPCQCRAQPQPRAGKFAGLFTLPAMLSVPAAIAEELVEQAQQAVEQGKDVAEQAQQQFKLPSDLQYPSGSGLKIPGGSPSTSGLEDYVSQNPAIIAAGVGVVAVGLVIARLVGRGVNVKKLTAAKAFDLLSSDSDIIFIDLRSKQEVNEAGSPDLRSIKRKITSLPYTTGLAGDLVEGFPDKLLKLPGLSEDSEILFFDSYGQDAKAVSGAVREGVKQVYYVADGADGVRGWRASQLPWREPSRFNFNLDFSGLKGLNLDKVAEDFKSKPTLTKAGLAVGALGAAAVVLFNEVEVVLEVLGVAAAGNFLAKKLLFAKDREQTVEQIRDIVDNKIAAGEVGKDLRRVADTLVETVTETEKTVDKNVSPEIKDSYKKVQQSGKKAVAWGKEKISSLESDAESASKDVQKSAQKTGNKVQSQAQSVTDKGKNAGKDIKSEAKSVGKDIKSEAKSVSKDAEQAADKTVKSADKATDKAAQSAEKTADKAQDQTKNLASKGKQAGQEAKSQAGSAGKGAQQATDKAGSKVESTAQQAKSKADGAGSTTQDQFQKQKQEVVGESKENIKEAEETLQKRSSSNSTSNGGPEVPSQQDVKQQAKEAQNWIQAWRKKQPVKTNT
ncbi:TPA: hypothetical protein ACH3X2_003622 [Trebouxia sp. C0005]|nr:MAG: rhodanese-like domain-containing protein [Trebouxia sp. A1-2]